MLNTVLSGLCKLSHSSCIQLFATPWAVALQTPLSMDTTILKVVIISSL